LINQLLGFQIQQKKLAEMITEITKASIISMAMLVYLMNEGKATPATSKSMAKTK
jgi:glutaryl-CoA dehydrogenase